VRVKINSLNLEFQTRECLDPVMVERYYWQLRRGEKLEPVIVYSDGHTRWLADGFHRVRAAERAGRKMVEAEIIRGTFEDMEKRWQEYLNELRRELRRARLRHG
jgi:hypothetical protein